MIAYLQGKVICKKEKFVVVNVNNIGYKIFLSRKNLMQIKTEELITLFCFLYVRENALDLYGFLNWQERELFGFVNAISGVGPKAALEISSLGPLEKIRKAAETGDKEIFKGISGIGPKKAKKILLEISGKIKQEIVFSENVADADPAVGALINLGFPRQKAKQALEKTDPNQSLEERIKTALRTIKNG